MKRKFKERRRALVGLKVLPLPRWCYTLSWINTEQDILDCFSFGDRYKEIEPIVGRPGWYQNNYDEWYEVFLKGKLRSFKELYPGMFAYELKLLDHSPLSKDEIKLMNHFIAMRGDRELCNRMRALLDTDKEWKVFQNIRRFGFRSRLKYT